MPPVRWSSFGIARLAKILPRSFGVHAISPEEELATSFAFAGFDVVAGFAASCTFAGAGFAFAGFAFAGFAFAGFDTMGRFAGTYRH